MATILKLYAGNDGYDKDGTVGYENDGGYYHSNGGYSNLTDGYEQG